MAELQPLWPLQRARPELLGAEAFSSRRWLRQPRACQARTVEHPASLGRARPVQAHQDQGDQGGPGGPYDRADQADQGERDSCPSVQVRLALEEHLDRPAGSLGPGGTSLPGAGMASVGSREEALGARVLVGPILLVVEGRILVGIAAKAFPDHWAAGPCPAGLWDAGSPPDARGPRCMG